MTQHTTPIDLSALDPQDIDAIEKEALRRGVSFDEACKQLLLEYSRRLQEQARIRPLERLMRFLIASQK